MRKLDNWFPDLSLFHYRVLIDNIFGDPSPYHFYAVDCDRAVYRLKTVMYDYPGYNVDFDTLCVFDDRSKRWEKCILVD